MSNKYNLILQSLYTNNGGVSRKKSALIVDEIARWHDLLWEDYMGSLGK